MRVLHVLDTLDRHPGLFATALPGFLLALRDAGVAADVVAGASHDRLVPAMLAADHVGVVDEDETSACMAELAARAGAADLVHVHAPSARIAMLAGAAARARSKPLVVSTHGELTRDLPAKGKFSLWFENRRFHKKFRGAALHGDSQREAALLQRRGIGGCITVLPTGFAAPRPDSAPPSDDIEPMKLPWDDDKRILAYFGDLDGRLGLVELLEACDALGDTLAEWRLVVAGRPIDNWLDVFQTAIRRRGKEHLAEFVVYPDVSQQAALLAAADFVVVPALWPTPPWSALWAMTGGRPVLVTEAVALDDVGGSGAGTVVPASADGVREGLERMTADSRDELRARGRRAAELAGRRFAWPAIIADYVAWYRRLLA